MYRIMKSKNSIFFVVTILFITIILTIPASAHLMKNKSLDNSQDIEAFADDFFKQNAETMNIPGAVLVVVRDGNVVLKKGYGYSDIEKKLPINPDKTVFRVASISKLFVSTAMMQLKEQGIVDFNTDINEYLKNIEFDYKYSKPVTIENLLTHTAGFDEQLYTGNWYDNSKVTSFYENANKYKPPFIRKAGQVIQYSNYGMQIAGGIIEDVSGEDFSDYIENHILKPLKMNNSSFKLTEDIKDNMAKGYYYGKNKYIEHKSFNINQLPAGGLNSTGSDMANFIIAQLQEGKFEDKSIISKDSIIDMQSQHFTNEEILPGMCYGFLEDFSYGERIIYHSGSYPGWRNKLVLIPDKNIGYFLSINSSNGDGFIEKFCYKFMENFYPESMAAAAKSNHGLYKNDNAGLEKFKGVYTLNRINEYSFGKIFRLVNNQDIIVDSKDNGYLHVYSPGTKGFEYKQIGPYEFNLISGYKPIAFSENYNQKVEYMFDSCAPEISYKRIQWYEARNTQLILFIIMIIIFLAQILFACVCLFRKQKISISKDIIKIRKLAVMISIINIMFVVCIILWIFSYRFDIYEIILNIPTIIKILLYIPLVNIPLTAVLLFRVAKSYKITDLSVVQKIYYSVITLCSISFIWFLNYWCMYGFWM